MQRIFVVLIVIFAILLVIAVNAYIFLRISGMFNIKRSWLLYALILVSAFIFPLFNFLVVKMNNSVVREFYTITGIYAGALFISFCVLILFEIINLIFKVNNTTSGIIILAIILVISIYAVINASFINVKTISLQDDNLKKEVKIVQVSDVHLGAVHGYSYMKKIVDSVNSQNPDMVLITGDLFDGSGDVPQDTINLLNNIKADVYFTTGNHEEYYGLDKALKQIGKTKAIILRNESRIDSGVQVIGIDNPAGFIGGSDSALGKININRSMPSILMFHPPTGLDEAEKDGIFLQLSGHAHRGQIFPFEVFTRIFYKYVYGLHEQGNTTLYVTSGTGTWGPAMRLLTNSEIVVFDIQPEQ